MKPTVKWNVKNTKKEIWKRLLVQNVFELYSVLTKTRTGQKIIWKLVKSLLKNIFSTISNHIGRLCAWYPILNLDGYILNPFVRRGSKKMIYSLALHSSPLLLAQILWRHLWFTIPCPEAYSVLIWPSLSLIPFFHWAAQLLLLGFADPFIVSYQGSVITIVQVFDASSSNLKPYPSFFQSNFP